MEQSGADTGRGSPGPGPTETPGHTETPGPTETPGDRAGSPGDTETETPGDRAGNPGDTAGGRSTGPGDRGQSSGHRARGESPSAGARGESPSEVLEARGESPSAGARGESPSEVLEARGESPSAVLEARGESPSVVPRARGENPSVVPRARGENPSTIPGSRGESPSVIQGASRENPSVGDRGESPSEVLEANEESPSAGARGESPSSSPGSRGEIPSATPGGQCVITAAVDEMQQAVAVKRKISLSGCEACGAAEAKYRCPRCMTHSCSLFCVKKHKAEDGCSGVRDRTAFTALSQFNEIHLLSDYRFLEDTGRMADIANRDQNAHRRSSSGLLNRMKNRARKYNIDLKLLPIGFSKRRENSTFFNMKKQMLYWHVKLVFPQSDTEYTAKRVSGSTTLEELLNKYIHPVEADPVIRQKLKIYTMVPLSGLRILMKAENRKCNSIRACPPSTRHKSGV
ncbi:uncharacterized protein znhit6 isoform X2 [Mustelus asterias]